MKLNNKWMAVTALGMAFAGTMPAQEQAPAQRNTGGWRKFGEPARPVQAQPVAEQGQADAALPPEAYQPPQGPDQGPPPPASRDMRAPYTLTLPAGTWITVRVNQGISSDHNVVGDSFTASLSQPLIADGYVVARRGQTLAGRVADVEKAGRVKGTSRLGLELTEISLVDGQQLPVKSQLMEYHGGTSVGQDATAIGVTTGIGAAIGGAAAGGAGAGIGAGAGALASTIGVLVTRGRATTVYPEAELTFRLMAPVTISTERSEQAFHHVRQEDYQRNTMQRRAEVRPVGPPAPYYYPGPGYYYGGYPYYGPGYGIGFGYGWGPSFYYRSGPRYYGRGGYRRW